MNKEEDYRNLAGNITAFTDNTCYYEDWLVIQQYVDDWLDEIDRLNNIIKELEKWLEDYIKLFDEPDMLEEQTCEDLKEVLNKLQELKENK